MRRKPVTVACISCFLTLLSVFLVFNFMPSEKKIERQLQRLYTAEDPQFRRSMGVLLGPPILDGNRVDVLLNGDQIFPAMLKAIHDARHSITFETYIYWSETIGKEFSDALIERAQAGVKVHVMLDFIGSIKLDTDAIARVQQAGVQLQRYHKPVWWTSRPAPTSIPRSCAPPRANAGASCSRPASPSPHTRPPCITSRR